jgi:hypothetical protein
MEGRSAIASGCRHKCESLFPIIHQICVFEGRHGTRDEGLNVCHLLMCGLKTYANESERRMVSPKVLYGERLYPRANIKSDFPESDIMSRRVFLANLLPPSPDPTSINFDPLQEGQVVLTTVYRSSPGLQLISSSLLWMILVHNLLSRTVRPSSRPSSVQIPSQRIRYHFKYFVMEYASFRGETVWGNSYNYKIRLGRQ